MSSPALAQLHEWVVRTGDKPPKPFTLPASDAHGENHKPGRPGGARWRATV